MSKDKITECTNCQETQFWRKSNGLKYYELDDDGCLVFSKSEDGNCIDDDIICANCGFKYDISQFNGCDEN